MPAALTNSSFPGFRKLGEGLSRLSSLNGPKPLTSDSNETTNSGGAAGSELVSQMLLNTSEVTGLGSKIDMMA